MDLQRISYILSQLCKLDPERPLLLGLSGGADSLTLFHVLISLGYDVIPAHFDHQLRPNSTKDADTLTKMLHEYGYSLVRGTDNIGSIAGQQKMNIEETGRVFRYQFLFDQARIFGAQAVLTAHTADDQVETVLMHILRGSAIAGLTGMAYIQAPNPWEASIPLIRPLLDLWRADIIEYCQQHALSPITDETNADPKYMRNRVRLKLIPELERNYNPQVKTAILRLSTAARDEIVIVNQIIDTAWEKCCTEFGSTYIRFRHDCLNEESTAVQHHLFRRVLQHLVIDKENIDQEVIQKAVDTVRQLSAGREIQLLEGIFLTRVGDDLLFCQNETDEWLEMFPQIHESGEIELGKVVSLGKYWALQMDQVETCSLEDVKSQQNDPYRVIIDAEKITTGLIIRSSQPGERFQPFGLNGQSIKLSDYFINEKLTRRARSAYPIVVCGNEVVWIPGFRLAHPFRVTRDTRYCLILKLLNLRTAS